MPIDCKKAERQFYQPAARPAIVGGFLGRGD